MRLRETALPILAAVMMPSRERDSGGKFRQFATRHEPVKRRPSWRAREKSRRCLMRAWRPNPSGCPPGMANPLNRGQTFAAVPAAVAQDGAAAFAGIAAQEAVLPFAPNFRRLILSLHKISPVLRAGTARPRTPKSPINGAEKSNSESLSVKRGKIRRANPENRRK